MATNDYKASDIISVLYNIDGTEQEILEKYANSNNYEKNALEMPDQLINVNGAHIYKLLSAKDIEWNNIFLKYSAIPDKNWGTFDINRRWQNRTPIFINDAYELMNVVDYLLCACQDLYNEIRKMQNLGGDDTSIWFLTNANENNKIFESNKINSTKFKIDTSNSIVTYLDPTKYYTTLTTNNNANGENFRYFGFGSQFTLVTGENIENDANKIIRQIPLNNKRNGIPAFISELQAASPTAQNEETIDNTLVPIFGYTIGSDLLLYPGYNIDNFLKTSNRILNIPEIVDLDNKKLKYVCYVRNIHSGYSIFEKLYIDFLNYNGQIEYIIYFKSIENNNIIKKAIYKSNANINYSSFMINSYAEYQVYNSGQTINLENNNGNPYIYVIRDNFSIDLKIITPNTSKFQRVENDIEIEYYKDKNSWNTIEVKSKNDNNEYTLISTTEDNDQISPCLFDKNRYNVPENTEIDFTLQAKYQDGVTDDLKTDDEYNDVMIYLSNIDNSKTYYNCEEIIQTSNNYGKRNFQQIPQSFFNNLDANNQNILFDNSNNPFVQLYEKIENPYLLTGELAPNVLIKQNSSIDYIKDVKGAIQYINDNNLFYAKSKDTYTLSYVLPNDIEQIKFNIDFNILETSKTTEISHTIPININKIHNPILHYTNDYDTNIELGLSYYDVNYMYYYLNGETIPDDPPTVGLSDVLQMVKEKGAYYHSDDIVDNSNTNISEQYIDISKRIWNNNDLSFEQRTSNVIGNNENILYFSYNSSKPYVNLLGGKETIIKKLQSHKYHNLSEISLKNGNNFDVIMNNSTTNKISYMSLFDITNFGKNFKFSGKNPIPLILSNNGVITNYSNFLNINDWTIRTLNNDYDIFVTKVDQQTNNNDNITNFLSFKLEGLSENANNYNQYNNTDNIITTSQLQIVKESLDDNYIGIVQRQAIGSQNNNTISCKVPIAYLDIKSTTFYPNPSQTQPSNNAHEYDLNSSNDIIKLQNYINSWGSIVNNGGAAQGGDNYNNYHPITLSMKLAKNIDSGIPYFNESNEVKLKFNILREAKTTTEFTPAGLSNNPIYIGVNTRYYLSYFMTNSLNNVTGSIWKYTNNQFVIEEYKGINISGNNINKNVNEIWFNINNNNYAYCIPQTTNNDYDYNIYEVCRLNKFLFNKQYSNGDIKNTPINIIINGIQSNLNDIDNDPLIIDYDPTLYYFNVNFDNLKNYLTTNLSNMMSPITITLNSFILYGNIKYYTNVGAPTNPNILIKLIYREKPANSQISYPEIEINNTIYEFFEYKYELNKDYYTQVNEFINI